MGRKKSLVHGVGINDAEYSIKTIINGKQVSCLFYTRWANMLERCYSKNYQSRYPTYNGCCVCVEWLTFSNFKRWMEKQDWQGKELDKDLLFARNKRYSPETCVFVDVSVNQFLKDRASCRGEFKTGVCYSKSRKCFISSCGNPITKKREFLGHFNTEEDAHLAWKNRKHELACQLAELQADQRVINALKCRYC